MFLANTIQFFIKGGICNPAAQHQYRHHRDYDEGKRDKGAETDHIG
ncbi:MAG: hypothetical protein O3A84_03205 [Proteobacteria bacterium]|nr:hypothetical protein [Pseudomonadota bacterium]